MSDLVRILIGPLAWLALFSAVYGLHGLICGLGLGETEMFGLPLLRLVLGLAWVGAIALQAAILIALYTRRSGPASAFVRNVSRTTAWVGLIATVWTLAPIAAATSCG